MNPDDSRPDDGWSSLAAAWQAQPVDLAALRRATARRTRRMQLLMLLDVVFVIIAAVLTVQLFVSNASAHARLGAIICIVALALALALNWRLRHGLWQPLDDSAVALLRLQRKRCVNAMRMALWGPLFLPLGLVAGGLLARAKVPAEAGLHWPPVYKLVLLAVVLVVFGIGTLLYVRRQRRRIAAIDAHLAQLE